MQKDEILLKCTCVQHKTFRSSGMAPKESIVLYVDTTLLVSTYGIRKKGQIGTQHTHIA